MEYTPDIIAQDRKREELIFIARSELGEISAKAAFVVDNFVRLSPPQDPPILMHMVVAKRGGHDGGMSRKPGNIRLNWRRLFMDSPDLILTGAGAIATPWLIPLAALSIFIKVWTHSAVSLSKEHAASLFAMWHRCDANRKIPINNAINYVNELFDVYSWPQIDEPQFRKILSDLAEIECITIDATGEVWLREWVQKSYS